MSERVTIQGKIGRSATTSLLDEGIDPYQNGGWILRKGGPPVGTALSICMALDCPYDQILRVLHPQLNLGEKVPTPNHDEARTRAGSREPAPEIR